MAEDVIVGWRAVGLDDGEVCACCGRTDLRRRVLIAPVDCDGAVVGEPVPHGVVCAARVVGVPASVVRRDAESAEFRRRREAADDERRAREELAARLAEYARPVSDVVATDWMRDELRHGVRRTARYLRAVGRDGAAARLEALTGALLAGEEVLTDREVAAAVERGARPSDALAMERALRAAAVA